MANGIYKVKNKPLLIMLDLDTKTQECLASYTNEEGALVQNEPLGDFIKKM